jgi:hypothetical protein
MDSQFPTHAFTQQHDRYDDKWAMDIRDATRWLVCIYARALEAVLALNKPWQRVVFGGLNARLNIFVVKPLLRDALIHHVQVNLNSETLLALETYLVQRPTPDETRIRVNRKNATPEQIEEAEGERNAFLDKQRTTSALLNEAMDDIKSLKELLSGQPSLAVKLFKTGITLLRRVAPLAVAGWVITRFDHLRAWPTWQEIGFAVLILVVYHFVAWASLPFFNAAYRKHLLLNGYGFIGKPSDGLIPMFPDAARLEVAFFKLFDLRPPVVVSWDEVVPALHYVVLIIFIIALLFVLPLAGDVRYGAWAFGTALIFIYIQRITEWWSWVHQRYRGRNLSEIAWALLSIIDWGAVLEPTKQDSN